MRHFGGRNTDTRLICEDGFERVLIFLFMLFEFYQLPTMILCYFFHCQKKKITATITAKAASHIFMRVKQNNEFKVLSTECLVPSWHSDKGYLLSIVHLCKCCPQHAFLTWMFCFEVPCFSSLFSIVLTPFVQVINLAVFLAEFLRFYTHIQLTLFFFPQPVIDFSAWEERYTLWGHHHMMGYSLVLIPYFTLLRMWHPK